MDLREIRETPIWGLFEKGRNYHRMMGIYTDTDRNYNFYNGRPITRSMLAWWAMQQEGQQMPNLDTVFEVEHIYARNRNENEKSLTDKWNVEKIGNKALLEKRINIRASDYRFADKVKYYQGFTNNKGEKKDGTINIELVGMAKSKTDFVEQDILNRTNLIMMSFVEYLEQNSLVE